MMTRIVSFRTWLLVFGILVCLIFGLKQAWAQNSDPGTKYGITYPIVELGSCTDYSSCRSYCEDPVHKDACISFAKSKGFYKEDATTIKAQPILDAAKTELGCSSYDSCKSFCQVDSNKDKCDSFAKSHQLTGGRVDDPAKSTIIQKAKEVLGCNSEDSCKSYCSQASNSQKCSDFAKSVGLKGGEVHQGPGGCSSEQTCKTFCADPANFDTCSKFAGSNGGPSGQFKGPGGCDSPQSCQSYCSTHQSECSKVSSSDTAPVNTKEFVDFCHNHPDQCMYDRYCKENPAKCQKDFTTQGVGVSHPDMGSCKTPGECYDWCKANTDKCSGFNPNYPRPDDSKYQQYTQTNYSQQSPYPVGSAGVHPPLRSNPPTTSGGYAPNMSRADQEVQCKSGGGTCTSSDPNFCGCQGFKGSSMPPPSSYSNSGYGVPPGAPRDQQEASCHSCNGSCNWSGDSCNCHCGSTGTPPQPNMSPPPPNTPPPSPTVKGISTSQGLLQMLLQLLHW